MSTTFIRFRDVINVAPESPLLSSKSAFDANDDTTFFWTFSDPNLADSQGAYEIQIQRTSDNVNVVDSGKVTSTDSEHTVTGGTLTNATTYRWRVRTYDSEDEVGPWSSYSAFSPTAGASISIVEPEPQGATPDIFDVSDIVVEWTYSHPDDEDQDEYSIVLYDSGQNLVVDTGWISSSSTTHELGDLETDSYELWVQVRTNGVESNLDSVMFDVEYDAPDPPAIAVDERDHYVRVAVTNPEPTGDRPFVTTNEVYRRRKAQSGDPEDWTRIAILDNNGTHDDYTVAADTTYEYYIKAVGSGSGSTDTSVEDGQLASTFDGVLIHDVQDPADSIVAFVYAIGRNEAIEIHSEALLFHGRTHPVTDFGPGERHELSLRIEIPPDDDGGLDALIDVVRNRNLICVRDDRKRVIFGTVRNIDIRDRNPMSTSVSLTLTRNSYTIEV